MPSLGGDNNIDIIIDSRANTQGVDKARQATERLDDTARSSKLGEFFKNNYEAAGTAAGGFIVAAGLATGAALKQAAGLEQTRIGFETMLKSGEKANALMQEISEFAAETPFEFPEIAAAGRSLLAFGFQSGEIVDTLRRLGDVSSGLNIPIGEMSELYGKARVQGRLFMEDINQLTGRGVPIISELAKVMGVAEGEVRGLVEEGSIGFPELEKAFQNLTNEGGLFAGGMKKQSESMSGMWSTLQDNIGMTVNKLLGIDAGGNIKERSIFAAVRDGLEALNPALEALQPKLEAFGTWLANNQPALFAIAGAIGGLLVLALGALVVAFGGAMLMMAGFAAAGAAIGALAAVIIMNWSSISGFFTGIWSGITGMATAAWNGIVGGLLWLKDNWFEAIGFMIGFFATLPIKLPIYAYQAVMGIVGWFQSINWGAVAGAIGNAFWGMWEGVKGAAQGAWNFISNINWGAVLSSIGRGIANAVIGLVEGGINGALSGIPNMPRVNLPRFATGVRDFRGGWAIVGEHGPEAVRLPQGSSVYSAGETRGMGGGLSVNFNGPVNVRSEDDLHSIARLVMEEIDRSGYRTSMGMAS